MKQSLLDTEISSFIQIFVLFSSYKNLKGDSGFSALLIFLCVCVCQSHIPPVTLRVLQSPLYTKDLVVQWFPQYLEHWNLLIWVILCFQSGMLIAPVLANLGPLEALKFRPNPSEVCSCQLRLSVEMVNLKKKKNKINQRMFDNTSVKNRTNYTFCISGGGDFYAHTGSCLQPGEPRLHTLPHRWTLRLHSPSVP